MVGVLLVLLNGAAPPEPLILESISGDIRVYVVAESLAPPTRPVTLHTASEDIEWKIAAGVPLRIRTVSGDISVDFGGPRKPFPPFVEIQSVSGDIQIRDLPPCTLYARTHSGDLILQGKGETGPGVYHLETFSGEISGVFPLVPATVQTFRGAISLEIPEGPSSPWPDTLRTATGGILIRSQGELLEVEKDTMLSLGNRIVVVDIGAFGWKEKAQKKRIAPNLDLLRPVAFRRAWGEIGAPPLLVDFNRVDGVAWVFSFRRVSDLEQARIRVQAEAGIRLALSREIPYAASALEKRVGMWGKLTVGVGGSTGISLYGEGWSTMTGTFDRWVLSDVENALAALFLGMDFYDYFLTSALGTGIQFQQPGFWVLRIGVQAQELSPLPVGAMYGLFSKKPFRSNPDFAPLSLRGLVVNGALRHGPLDFSLRYYRDQRCPECQQLMVVSRMKSKLPVGRLLARLAAGFGTPDYPFNFRVGGIGTLPAYPFHKFQGDRMVLFNVDFELPSDLGDLIFFADVGQVSDSPWAIDLGVGLRLDPFSLRVVRSLESPGMLKAYLRLGDRF